ncbi:hypothetical protein C8Q76DRAFT_694223 [Earliella scabrosa]|nr:hypothetical protein C8Q76DRAFT_694223 [Earliella scabrosa]
MPKAVDIVPIFATYTAVYAYGSADINVSGIDPQTKWEHCSVVIPLFDGPVRGVIVRQDPCPRCGFAGQWIATDIVQESMSFRAEQKNCTVSWQPSGWAQRLHLRFHVERDFWWFVNEYSDALLTRGGSSDVKISMERIYELYEDAQSYSSSAQIAEVSGRFRASAPRGGTKLDQMSSSLPTPSTPSRMESSSEVLVRLAGAIHEVSHQGEVELLRYLADVGIQGLEDDRKLRKDLLRALTMRNSKYRSSTLRMLRREAREIRAQDLAAPVREELARAMISQSTLHANVEELSSLLDRKMGQAAPTLMAAYRENTTTIRDLPVLDTMLYEPTFEVMLQPLKGPLPSRTQKRPLYRLMAQISSLRRMRQRAVKRTDGSRELTVEEARQIWHQAQRLGWKQNELIARLEGLFITAEMMPSSLRLLAGRTTSIEAIIGSVKRYRKVKIGLEVLQQAFPQIIDIYPFVAANCNSQFLVSTLCRSLCPASQHMEFDGYRSRHRPIRDSVTLAPPLEPYPTEEASMSDSSTSSSEASFVTASDGDPAPTLSGYDMQGIEEENVSLSYATNLIAGPMGAITSGNSAGGASHTRRSTKRHTRSPSPNTTGRSSESGRVSKRARTTPQSPPARNPRSMRRPRRDGTAVHRTSLSAGTVQSRVAVPGTSHAGLAGSGASVDPFLSPVAECTALTVPQSSPDAGSSCTHCCALEVQVQQMRSDIDDIRRDVRDVREALDTFLAAILHN